MPGLRSDRAPASPRHRANSGATPRDRHSRPALVLPSPGISRQLAATLSAMSHIMPRKPKDLNYQRIAEHLAAARCLAHQGDASLDFLLWTEVKLTPDESRHFHNLITEALERYSTGRQP